MQALRAALFVFTVLAMASAASARTRGRGIGGSVFDGEIGVQIRKDVCLGGGANFMLTETTAAFGEVKYVIGDWDGWAVTGGIYL